MFMWPLAVSAARLPQHYHSCLALRVQDHGHETVPAGVYKEEFWEERELDCSHSPDGTPKPRMDWAVLAKAKGQEKARAMRMVWKPPGVDWIPWTRSAGRNVVSGHGVLLETRKSLISGLCAHWEKWRRVCVSITQRCYRRTLRLNFRAEKLPWNWEQGITGSTFPGTVIYNQGRPTPFLFLYHFTYGPFSQNVPHLLS